jgi:hypothetical protein
MSNARNLAGIVTDTPSTTSLSMPVGTTAQRPASPQAGMYRLNSTTGEPEWYDTVSGSSGNESGATDRLDLVVQQIGVLAEAGRRVLGYNIGGNGSSGHTLAHNAAHGSHISAGTFTA